ncbi:MAG TPA: TIGR04255 family protein [Candidatus Kapabacteria bacterium]|nr:TIGR04255 family protein [Candidatus Kapabacteria bacterium]HOV92530.1 TIGR04255 family protein [Candidatus Kapabacteria bacterium]
MNNQYINPPLVEALCEIQFISTKKWDLTIPGIFYSQIKDEFPNKKELMGVGLELKGTESGLEQTIIPTPPKLQFFSHNNNSLVQLSPDLLAVNCLKPYPSWSKFKPLILKILEIYRGIANPEGILSITLRYINVIEFKDKSKGLKDYLKFYVHIPEDIPNNYNQFLSRVNIPYNDDQLILFLGSIPSENEETNKITLDINFTLNNTERITFNGLSDWLDNAHKIINSSFESCITDNARKLFGEGNNGNN